MTGRAPLTLIERAKVAAAVGGTVNVPGPEMVAICELAALAGEARGMVAMAEEQSAAADNMAALAQDIVATSRRRLRLSIVFAGIGIGGALAAVLIVGLVP